VFRIQLPITFFVTLAAVSYVPAWAEEQDAPMFDSVRETFANPGMRYAPFAFWFWDEPIEPGKAAAMAERMLGQRLNPGYAHARHSMVGTPSLEREDWLGEDWFRSFGETVAVAKEHNAYMGYCDEYWWPSMQAAGRVLDKHPELRAQSLGWETRDIAPGATVELAESLFVVAARLDQPPETADTKRPEAELGQWIWRPEGSGDPHFAYFRKEVDLPADKQIEAAWVRITADNKYTLHINGKEAASDDDWYGAEWVDVAGMLHAGRNLLAVEAWDDAGVFGGGQGLLLGMRARFSDGTTCDVPSDGSWLTTGEPGPDWTSPAAPADSWTPARVIGPPEIAPWHFDARILGRHPQAVIHSATLAVIGGGAPFVWTAPDDGWWRLYLYSTRDSTGIDGGLVNYIDERLAPAFIALAHQPYEDRFPKDMGATIPGVFVDNEGDYGHKLAWSESLPVHYEKLFGADIRATLPLLADRDSEGRWPQARWRWFEAVSDLYAANLGGVSDWLADRDMHCISNLWEESLMWQAAAVGDFFKLQRAYSMPGNDCLQLKALDVHDFIETHSVCSFENRRFMTELMGAGGWESFSPITIKQSTNAVIAWGVSHIVPHGIFTTRKLEGNIWMPDWFEANPFWPWMHLWTDFARRASYINAQGHTVADVLLLNPMDSVWALCGTDVFDPATQGSLWDVPNWFDPEVREIDAAYTDAVRRLTAARVPYLVADRHYLSQMEQDGALLRRGPHAFRAVVIPPVAAMPVAAVEKLADFAGAGGHVYALGTLPRMSTDLGLGDPALYAAVNRLRDAPGFTALDKPLGDALEAGLPGLASPIRGRFGAVSMLEQHRVIDGRHFFWLANNSFSLYQSFVVVDGIVGAASIWDCETGAIRPLAARRVDSGIELNLVFEPLAAFWLVIDPEADPQPDADPEPVWGAMIQFQGPWKVRVPESLQPILDNPSPPLPELIEPDGTTRDLGNWADWGMPAFSGVVEYTALLELGTAPKYAVRLNLGFVYHAAEVIVNGKSAGARLWYPFHYDVTDLLAPGTNTITVRVANLANSSYGKPATSGMRFPVTLEMKVSGPNSLATSGLVGPVTMRTVQALPDP
jgi:hypothetical protein